MKCFKLLACAALLMGTFLFSSRAEAGTLFGATSAGGPGQLYVLNPSNGSVITNVGPLNDVTGANYPVTGLAVNPLTGVLYGSTGNAGSQDAKLITINPTTGLVTLVGSFSAGPVNSGGTPTTMSDLAFDSAGNLYGIASIGGPQLYTINVATAQATLVGNSGLTSTAGGGLAISSTGTFFGTPTSARFGTYNPVTGAFTNITNPTKPVGGAYAALAFDGSLLYGLDLGPTPGATALVNIDPVTGAVTNLGNSVDVLDAIAFVPGTSVPVVPVPAAVWMGLVTLTGMVGWQVAARRKIATTV